MQPYSTVCHESWEGAGVRGMEKESKAHTAGQHCKSYYILERAELTVQELSQRYRPPHKPH